MIIAPSMGSSRSAGFCRSPRPLPAGECPHSPRGTYHAHLATRRDPSRAGARARRDAGLIPEVRRVWEENFRVYGVRKVWRQLRRESFDIARCTVARLMKTLGLQGVVRGRARRTTIHDPALPCPLDLVNRQFRAPAPNRLCPCGDARIACRVTGQRFHVRQYLAGLRVCRLRHRHLRRSHRRLAGLTVPTDPIRPRCARAGPARAQTGP